MIEKSMGADREELLALRREVYAIRDNRDPPTQEEPDQIESRAGPGLRLPPITANSPAKVLPADAEEPEEAEKQPTRLDALMQRHLANPSVYFLFWLSGHSLICLPGVVFSLGMQQFVLVAARRGFSL